MSMSYRSVVKRVALHCNEWDLTRHAYDNATRGALISLRGGKPLFSFQVEYTNEMGVVSQQIHTILDTAIIYIGDIRLKKVLTRYPISDLGNLDIYKVTNDAIMRQVDINYCMEGEIEALKQRLKEMEEVG